MSRPKWLQRSKEGLVLLPGKPACEMCGSSEGQDDPYQRNHRVQLVRRKAGKGSSAARVLCKTCTEGLHRAIVPPKPTLPELVTQVRRARKGDQLFLLAWLRRRFVGR